MRRKPLHVALALALLLVPVPVAAAPSVAAPAATAGFEINLVGPGDFVSQYTPYWCVGASMQMMLNIVGVTAASLPPPTHSPTPTSA